VLVDFEERPTLLEQRYGFRCIHRNLQSWIHADGQDQVMFVFCLLDTAKLNAMPFVRTAESKIVVTPAVGVPVEYQEECALPSAEFQRGRRKDGRRDRDFHCAAPRLHVVCFDSGRRASPG
jgi:hypothetical protein